jgi:hypothetical protein
VSGAFFRGLSTDSSQKRTHVTLSFFYLDESDLESEEEASDFVDGDVSVFEGGGDFASGFAAPASEFDELLADEFAFL